VPISSFFGGIQRFAGQKLGEAQRAYQQLDKSAGGWLPGGGVASPVTKAIFPPQPFPKRAEELQRITGVKGRFIDPEKTPSLVRQIAPVVAPMWGTSDYANPLLNEVGMSGYSGGRTEQERRTEVHELGHLNPKDKGLYSYFGVLGRSLQGVSNQTGNLPLVDLAAGLAMQHADAPEEDRAERFTKQFAKKQNYPAPVIYKDGTSNYGNVLRREGSELTSGAITRMADPFGVISGATQFINEQRAKPLREEMSKIEPEMRRLFASSDSYEVTPEQIKLGKRHSELQRQLESLNLK
jgi:hypothetical protein